MKDYCINVFVNINHRCMMHKNVFYDLKIHVTILSRIFVIIRFECRFGIICYWGSTIISELLPLLVNYWNVLSNMSLIWEI